MSVLSAENVKRKFIFKKDGKDVELEDFNPSAPPVEIVKFHSGTYPELTNAKIEAPDDDGKGNITFRVSTNVGTKG